MDRTTIMLPQDLKTRAVQAARRMGISLGEFLRQSAEAALAGAAAADGEYSAGSDPLLADEAVFTGKAPENLSLRHDEHL